MTFVKRYWIMVKDLEFRAYRLFNLKAKQTKEIRIIKY